MKNNNFLRVGLFLISIVLFHACAQMPKNAKPITDFDSQQYLGKWYEIARLDNRFEKNMNNVTAEYSKRDDGKIKVLNGGYDYIETKWKSAVGKAKFVDDQKTAALKVSFFGPFYSGYNVIALDDDYNYALVAGKDLSYLWMLSRTTSMPNQIKEEFLNKAQNLGYDTSKLIWVEHNKERPIEDEK